MDGSTFICFWLDLIHRESLENRASQIHVPHHKADTDER